MGKPTYENLSEVLSKLLSEKNIQQQELAKQSGLTKATISRLISGSRGKRTSFETLSKLARGLISRFGVRFPDGSPSANPRRN